MSPHYLSIYGFGIGDPGAFDDEFVNYFTSSYGAYGAFNHSNDMVASTLYDNWVGAAPAVAKGAQMYDEIYRAPTDESEDYTEVLRWQPAHLGRFMNHIPSKHFSSHSLTGYIHTFNTLLD